jgi:Family of unknown function (DUF6459)
VPTTSPHEHESAAHRVPLPVCEPPFDDERDAGRPTGLVGRGSPETAPVVQGSLALAHMLPGGVAAVPEPTTALRLVEVDHQLGSGSVSLRTSREAKPVPEPPDARRWSARLAQGIAEALSGHRPPQQLVRWTAEDVYEMLTHRLAGRAPADRPRPMVRSVRVCRPRHGVVEATAVVDASGRCRALAFRLEADGGHWRCTALDII